MLSVNHHPVEFSHDSGRLLWMPFRTIVIPFICRNSVITVNVINLQGLVRNICSDASYHANVSKAVSYTHLDVYKRQV